jgi:hypothetical protein
MLDCANVAVPTISSSNPCVRCPPAPWVPPETPLPPPIAAPSPLRRRAASGEVWAAGCNSNAQLGLGEAYGARNPEFRLVRALKGAARSRARLPGRLEAVSAQRAPCKEDLLTKAVA